LAFKNGRFPLIEGGAGGRAPDAKGGHRPSDGGAGHTRVAVPRSARAAVASVVNFVRAVGDACSADRMKSSALLA